MKPFTDFLGELNGGRTLLALTKRLAKVVKAVKQNGGTGTITLKLTIKRNGEALTVAEAIDAKIPDASRGESIFFPNEEGDLFRDDPRQSKLPFREVAGDDGGEVKEVQA